MQGISTTGRPLADIDHLRQSIRDILTTRKGTRVMCRDYGFRLPELVDRPANPAFEMDVFVATAEALAQWEPRFELTQVTV
jgi:phage baseplate assembly protein W